MRNENIYHKLFNVSLLCKGSVTLLVTLHIKALYILGVNALGFYLLLLVYSNSNPLAFILILRYVQFVQVFFLSVFLLLSFESGAVFFGLVVSFSLLESAVVFTEITQKSMDQQHAHLQF